jgi:hypothetical protein
MTLHRRKVDDRTHVKDGCGRLHVPGGWQIADGSADDVRVCGAHPWQSDCLVFANGEACGTAACTAASCIGNAHFLRLCASKEKNCKQIQNADSTKTEIREKSRGSLAKR